MQTHVAKTSFDPRCKDSRNVNGYASELSMTDFAAETHLVVVACDIFISFISLSFRSVLCRLTLSFQFVEDSYIPSHCIGSSSLRSPEVFTDCSFNQASKIATLCQKILFSRWRDKSVTQETLLITRNMFLTMFQPQFATLEENNIFQLPSTSISEQNNHGKYRGAHYND